MLTKKYNNWRKADAETWYLLEGLLALLREPQESNGGIQPYSPHHLACKRRDPAGLIMFACSLHGDGLGMGY